MLPDWPQETVAVLATHGDAPHAIPVSAAVRAGPRQALIALAHGRGSLARLRDQPSVALAVIAPGQAVTINGAARVIQETLVAGVAAVEIEVQEVKDHCRPEFEIQDGVRWRWTDHAAADRDAQVRAALLELAQRLARS